MIIKPADMSLWMNGRLSYGSVIIHFNNNLRVSKDMFLGNCATLVLSYIEIRIENEIQEIPFYDIKSYNDICCCEDENTEVNRQTRLVHNLK